MLLLSHRVLSPDFKNSAAGSVAAYWNERRGGFITPSMPGHAMTASLIALGFAVFITRGGWFPAVRWRLTNSGDMGHALVDFCCIYHRGVISTGVIAVRPTHEIR